MPDWELTIQFLGIRLKSLFLELTPSPFSPFSPFSTVLLKISLPQAPAPLLLLAAGPSNLLSLPGLLSAANFSACTEAPCESPAHSEGLRVEGRKKIREEEV